MRLNRKINKEQKEKMDSEDAITGYPIKKMVGVWSRLAKSKSIAANFAVK